MNWPRSIPNYRWGRAGDGPALLARVRLFILSGIFYLGYLLGSGIASPLRRRRAILILRTDGLGDGVLSEPMIRAIAARYADARIHLWAPAAVYELFSAADYVHERRMVLRGFKDGCLEYFRSPKWRWKMGWNLGRYRFDIAIYPATSAEPFGNWILDSVRAQKRWVVKGNLFHQFDWQQSATLQKASRVLAQPQAVHELECNADIARQCGASEVRQWPQLTLDATAQEEASQFISRWQTQARAVKSNGLLGVITASSMSSFAWPIEKWRAALSQIWNAHRLLPVFLSPPVQFDAEIPFAHLDGQVSVLALAAILREMDTVLTLDTGPAHIAAAMRTPTIVLRHGGEPARFFPWPDAPWIKTLSQRMPCEGCICRCTLAEVECLTRIGVADVVGAVGELRNSTAAWAA